MAAVYTQVSKFNQITGDSPPNLQVWGSRTLQSSPNLGNLGGEKDLNKVRPDLCVHIAKMGGFRTLATCDFHRLKVPQNGGFGGLRVKISGDSRVYLPNATLLRALGLQIRLFNHLVNSLLSYTLKFQVNPSLKLRMRQGAIAHFLKAAAD